MKKGDIIEKIKNMGSGSILIRNCPDEDFAENQILHIEKHYNFTELPKMKTEFRVGDGLCVVLDQDSFLSIRAKINWIVDTEVAIEYLDTGGMVIFNLNEPDGQGWVVIHEATPVYQDSVEHMTDEQLRNSIEELRARRLSSPPKVTKKKTTGVVIKPVESAEDKELASVLGNMNASSKLELMKKLGLVD